MTTASSPTVIRVRGSHHISLAPERGPVTWALTEARRVAAEEEADLGDLMAPRDIDVQASVEAEPEAAA